MYVHPTHPHWSLLIANSGTARTSNATSTLPAHLLETRAEDAVAGAAHVGGAAGAVRVVVQAEAMVEGRTTMMTMLAVEHLRQQGDGGKVEHGLALLHQPREVAPLLPRHRHLLAQILNDGAGRPLGCWPGLHFP